MRKMSVIWVAAMLLATGSVFGNAMEKDDPAKTLQQEVRELLKGYAMNSEDPLTATVLFTVNMDKEFVVLSVRTDDKLLEYYIKAKLNYQTAKTQDAIAGRRYTLPIKIVG